MSAGQVILNGQRAGKQALRQALQALCTQDILAANGGFLIKATLAEDQTWIDIVPCVINGERTYHYDMKLAVETESTLIGAVNTHGIFTLFFQPAAPVISEADRLEIGAAFRRLARLITNGGYFGCGRLDWGTRKLLDETGIFKPAPESLLDLLGESDPASECGEITDRR